MSPEAFDAELADLGRLDGVRSLIFTDDTFNVPPQRFKELCRVLARHDFEWYSFFRPQFCDAETAQLMRASGCKAVFLGLESADDAMLKRMGKPAGIEIVRRGIRHLEDEGIALHANFILGFPGDVPENARKIVDLLDEHAIDFFYASPWYHSETSPIAKHAAEYGVEGRFFRWKHDTMTAEEAFGLEAQIQRAPRRALFMSEYTQFTFWGEIMLYVNGCSVADTRLLVSAFNAHAGRDASAAELRADPRIAEARALLARKPFASPADVCAAADIARRGGR
jgi:p-methyltransferase